MKNKTIFLDIANELHKRINEGVYVTSQKLPSEYDLAEEFGVSRLTIRKAIDSLISQNILVKEKGKGTYVMKQPKIASGLGGLYGFTEAAKRQGKRSKTKIIECTIADQMPEKVKQAFGKYADEKIIHLVRQRFLEDEPMTVEDIYVLQRYVSESSIEQLEEQSLFSEIEKNIEIGYSHQEVEAILVTEDLSRLLNVEVGQPLLLVHSLTYSPSAKPILYDTSFYRADKYTFKHTLQRKH